MKVTLDYLTGPVLGHKRRCEILRKVLVDRGHKVNNYGYYGYGFYDDDWSVVDYPKDQFPKRVKCHNRLVMGILPQEEGDWAWHPLAIPTVNTLTGASWLILDPKLGDYRDHPKRDEVLVTCGGADPFHLTEQILSLIHVDAVVIGENFNRHIEVPMNTTFHYYPSSYNMMEILSSYRTIVCTWGTTVFESLYLGAKVYPITLSDDHADEAFRLGTMFIRKESIGKLPDWMKETNHWNIDRPLIDLLGAERLCKFMERF